MTIASAQLKSIVLFPGAGIADFGYPNPPQAVVDLDKWGLEAYRQNHHGRTKLIEADLATETARSVIEKMGVQREPDLISSGSPCQGFSSGRGPDSQGKMRRSARRRPGLQLVDQR